MEYIHDNDKNKANYIKSLTNIIPVILENVPECHEPLNMSIINTVLKLFDQDYENPKNRLQNQNFFTVNMNGGFMNQVIPLELSTFKDILTGFAVTEKADGERYFVYIDDLYLLNHLH